MNIVDIIDKKRKNEILTEEEIKFFVNNYVAGKIEDYQASALLMAICINGLNDEELYNLTACMANSSNIIDLSSLKKEGNVVVDKHSTGGVGDKVTLIVLSIVACFGIKIFKMSGRGLGITGGTADKLESIKGYKLDVPMNKVLNQLEDINVCLISQSESIAVADKKLYALRDVTATTNSIPLIASSIMSKKIASNIDKLVINVTFGKGSFMKTLEDAKLLSETMINIGKKCDIEVKSVITNTDNPLGKNIGNSLEIEEVIEFLNCDNVEDLNKEIKEVIYEIAAQMIILSGRYDNKEEIYKMIDNVITKKEAYAKFISLIKYQGGKIKSKDGIERPILKNEKYYIGKITSKKEGFVTGIDSFKVGKSLISLGGGRKTKKDKIDYSVGVKIIKDIGEKVVDGDTLIEIHYNDNKKLEEALEYLKDAIYIEDTYESDEKYVYEVI